MRLDVLASLSLIYFGILKKCVLIPVKESLSSRREKVASEGYGKHTKASFSVSFYVGCHQKAWPRFRVGLPTSNGPIKKIPHTHAQLHGIWLIPDVVKLTFKIIHHTVK